MDWSFGWIALGSIATLGVVLVNIYLIFIKPCRERAEFSLEFEMKNPFCAEATSSNFGTKTSSDKLPTFWIRLKVKNKGRSVAQNCKGRLIEIIDVEGKTIDKFDPTTLLWVGTSWKEEPFRNISLNRKEGEYLDVLVTQEGDPRLHICGDQFVWATGYDQRAIKRYLYSGSYILHISIYGDKVNPETCYWSVVWNGDNFKNIDIKQHDTYNEARNWLNSRKNDEEVSLK